MVWVITSFNLQFSRDNFRMILSKGLELNISIREIYILESMLLISFMGKENMDGRVGLFMLVILKKVFDMIMENGFLQV